MFVSHRHKRKRRAVIPKEDKVNIELIKGFDPI